MDDSDEFMGGSFKTFAFNVVGDMVQGTVTQSPTKVQQRDMQTNEPKVWSDGRPQWMFQVTIQTELRDPTDPYDDGLRTLYLSWKRLDAVRAAIRESGAKNIEVGGQLALRFDGFGPETKKGFNPPKLLWKAWYKPPVAQADPAFMESPRTSEPPAFSNPSVSAPNGDSNPSSPVLDSMRRLAESQQASVDRLKIRQDSGDPPF